MSDGLTAARVAEAFRVVRDLLDRGDLPAAWRLARPLVAARTANPHAAVAVAMLLSRPVASADERVAMAGELVAAWPEDLDVLVALGHTTETLFAPRFPGAAPADHPVLVAIADALAAELDHGGPPDVRLPLAHALSTAARLAGPAHDPQAHAAFAERRALAPDDAGTFADHALFLKLRGRYTEGVAVARRAAELGAGPSAQANLAICATARGDGATALAAWSALGHAVAPGDDGLPAGTYAPVWVDPGDGAAPFQVARRSACHGDGVLVDVAPIGLHRADGRPILLHRLLPAGTDARPRGPVG